MKENNTLQNNTDQQHSNISTPEITQLIRQLTVQSSGGEQLSTSSIHKFWSTQPVPQLEEQSTALDEGPIEPNKDPEDIRKQPFPLLPQFEWTECDIENQEELEEVYQLLNANYVEDDDSMFRFDYSGSFLYWALRAPGWRKDWHVGVRTVSSKRLVAFISAIPSTICIKGQQVQVVEINFLCIHKKLRNKRLAPVLIKEITRRVNQRGIFQAVYTAGVVLPRPVARCRYYHRSLNPKKLIQVGFSRLGPRMTLSRTIKLYALPKDITIVGLEPLSPQQLSSARDLLAKYLTRFKLSISFSLEEFSHWFLPRKNVIYCYILKNEEGVVTDLISFYELPSTVIQHEKYKNLRAAYSFYNVATSVPLESLMQNALILAKQEGFDVFNALDLMENETFFKQLKFHPGDGFLHYYLYNWRCSTLPPSEMGLVLL
ncbi:hypothetical protein GpartN1_g3306.t1 [Galdieria partita]|uniref:Glycylpeptide N-tetradecanoyltransferase n=1 Tax=Galdieria partita TaxID=83374 RepID=A0A9C7UQF6_9RHOD|nr:hypothetical protein GpartN1_g160.t1 [Galdieria partita]GJQ11515.1 hypothetical protein GpartN1_g3306.t1 [Galdieria partita]